MFLLRFFGLCVIVKPIVINFPPSSGQHFRIGKVVKSDLSSICWHGAPNNELLDLKFVILFMKGKELNILSIFGGITFSAKKRISSPSSFGSQPKANFNLSSEPNRFVATGCSDPLTFSKIRAGPSSSIVLQVISVISRTGSTSVVILLKSPIRSRKSMYVDKSLNFSFDIKILASPTVFLVHSN